MKAQPEEAQPAANDDLSTLLAERIPLILDRWEKEVRESVPAAREQTRPALRDHIPNLLLELAQVLSPCRRGPDLQDSQPGSKLHAEDRARTSGYTLPQVLHEYRLLWNTILEVLDADGSLSEPELRVTADAILRGMEDAAAEYVAAEQRAAEGEENRLRGIQGITGSAVSHHSLRDLFQDLLERISELLAADTVAILLVEGDRLVVRAAKGLDVGVEHEAHVPLGEGFAGGIARAGQPGIISDLTPGAVVRRVLVRKGVRSLLGVPLMVERKVIGVLHVGSRQPHRFGREDVRLLQLVGDSVALAVDRTRLFAELEETNERKSEFLAMVAHELRTPISAINSALYILENIEFPTDQAGRSLLAANRQARQLSRLVEDLLDISRISQGKIELRKKPVPINRIALEAAEVARPLAEARGQEFRCDVTSSKLMVDADASRMEQILTNLLGNAVKYTEPGGSIRLSVRATGGEVEIRVSDTGIGIDPPMLPQIFDMFRQLESGDRSSQGGLGIGLALVKRLVELHGGTVSATSGGRGAGTEFAVRLPLLGAEEEPCR